MSKPTKRLLHACARRYVVEFLRAQDLPDWPFSCGYLSEVDIGEASNEFMDELWRIADRIEKTITPSQRKALQDAGKQDG